MVSKLITFIAVLLVGIITRLQSQCTYTSNNHSCTVSSPCTNEYRCCSDNMDCYIICNACKDATLRCPRSTNNCYIDFDGGASGQNTKIDASQMNGGTLNITLSGAHWVWQHGELLCPPNGKCYILATGYDYMSYDNIIDAKLSSLFYFEMYGYGGVRSLRDSTIYCPTNSGTYFNNIKNCIFRGFGSSSNQFGTTNIYSIEPLYNVDMFCYPQGCTFNGNIQYNVQFYCDPSYSTQYVFVSNSGGSLSGNSVQCIYDYISFGIPTLSPTEPTSNPTNSPSMPTAIPTALTMTPSTSPTQLTSIPTISPTSVPTSMPSVSPTHSTIFPTDLPSTSPTTQAPSITPTTAKPSISPTTGKPTSDTASPTLSPTRSPTEPALWCTPNFIDSEWVSSGDVSERSSLCPRSGICTQIMDRNVAAYIYRSTDLTSYQDKIPRIMFDFETRNSWSTGEYFAIYYRCDGVWTTLHLFDSVYLNTIKYDEMLDQQFVLPATCYGKAISIKFQVAGSNGDAVMLQNICLYLDTFDPTTSSPTDIPTTSKPTISPTTSPPTDTPTTTTTSEPTISPITSQLTGSPITANPTTSPITTNPTSSPITANPTTSPITPKPTLSPITAKSITSTIATIVDETSKTTKDPMANNAVSVAFIFSGLFIFVSVILCT